MFLLAASAAVGSPAQHLHSTSHRHAKATAARASRPLPHSLAVASARSTQADHALVAAANSLERCLAESPKRQRHCNVYRRAVQRAGSRLAAAQRRLSRIAHTTGKAARRGGSGAAPRLSVSGKALTWTKIGNVEVYLLVSKVPRQSPRYSVVTGTSVTPPPVPGATVRYSVRTATYWSAWSSEQSIAYGPDGKPVSSQPVPSEAPHGETVDTQAAPTIKVSGHTLSWSLVGHVSTYVLQSTVPGKASQYTEVSGATITPPAVPGASVHYAVRTAVNGSAWSTEVVISYPPAEATPPPPAPPTEPAPQESSTTFQPGLNSGTTMNIDVPGSVKLGAKLVRLAFNVNEPTGRMESAIGGYAAAGIRVLPVAEFYGTMPSPAEAQNLGRWAAVFGPGGSYWSSHPGSQEPIQQIEFGNETSEGYQYGDGAGSSSYRTRAEDYASRLKSAAEAISATGIRVGMLAQADDWTGDWVNGMYAAVANLSSYVAGWTIHPYGPGWRSRVEGLIKQTAAHGAPSTIPIEVTEWGISTDNGRCLSDNYGWNPCMSYQEAGEALTKSVGEMRQLLGSRLQDFMVYQVRDQQLSGTSTDREIYFGALQHELQPKGTFTTAVENLLAS
jgi:hypothetical protein